MASLLKRLVLALHHRITAKIAIAILGGVAAIGSLHSSLLTRYKANWLKEDFEAQARITAVVVHAALAPRPGREPASLDMLPQLLADLRDACSARRIALVDSTGRIAYSSEPGDVGTRIVYDPETTHPTTADGEYRSTVPLHDSVCRVGDLPELARLSGIVLDQRGTYHQRISHDGFSYL